MKSLSKMSAAIDEMTQKATAKAEINAAAEGVKTVSGKEKTE